VTSSDKEFAAATIQAIGRCASNISEVTDTCLNGLVLLMSNRDGKFSKLSFNQPEFSFHQPELSFSQLELSFNQPELSFNQLELSFNQPELSFNGHAFSSLGKLKKCTF
jgi:hypothetical protein